MMRAPLSILLLPTPKSMKKTLIYNQSNSNQDIQFEFDDISWNCLIKVIRHIADTIRKNKLIRLLMSLQIFLQLSSGFPGSILQN